MSKHEKHKPESIHEKKQKSKDTPHKIKTNTPSFHTHSRRVKEASPNLFEEHIREEKEESCD